MSDRGALTKPAKVFRASLAFVFHYLPGMALVLSGLLWVFWEVRADVLQFQFQEILGATAIAAAVGVLAFAASRTCEDGERKRAYYQEAERLFQATVLLAMATMLKFVIFRVGQDMHDSGSQIDAYSVNGRGMLVALLSIPRVFIFLYGVVSMVVSLTRLNRILYLSTRTLDSLADEPIPPKAPVLERRHAAESTTTRVIRAPRTDVYRTVVDVEEFAQCLRPDGATSTVLGYDNVTRTLRMQITHAPGPAGTRRFRLALLAAQPEHAATYGAAYETDDLSLAGEMRLYLTLSDVPEGTSLTFRYEGLPPAISIEDNEHRSASSLANLARKFERANG